MTSRFRSGIRAAALAALLAGAVPGGALAAETPATAVIVPANESICLAVDTTAVSPGQWAAIVGSLETLARERPLVFPETVVVARPDPAQAWASTDWPVATVAIANGTGSSPGTDAGDGAPHAADDPSCLLPGTAWALRVEHDLLQAVAQRILDSAGLASDVTTEIGVELVPADELVRTTLRFSAFLGVGGTCWVDDALDVDPATDRARSSDELHQDLHFLAPQDACTRFRAFMPDGAGGSQALALVPSRLPGEAAGYRLVTTLVDVTDGAVVIAGSVDER